MNQKGYFHRVHAETPTRFWINNPTREQARQAIEAGAIGCTTNPSYVSKLFNSPEDFTCVLRAIDLLLPYEKNDSIIASKVQRIMVSHLSDMFMPLYRESNGRLGLVTIQCDPYQEEDASFIINDGIENRRIAPNITVKIPVTIPGIEAISTLVEQNIPTMATEVMGLSQAVSICEAYKKASEKTNNTPPFFVTHITGILDDHFKRVIVNEDLDISPEAIKYAGLTIAKRQYGLLKERKYPGIMLGGGARKLEDFTELVGGDLHVTINWDGTAEVLIGQDRSVVSRIEAETEPNLVTELLQKLPDFRRAYDVDGMKPEEYYDYGAVELFRSSFMKGWTQLLDLIAERRRNQ
jgi:transaldolase